MTLLQSIALIVLGVVIGIVSSFFGIGGGGFLVPALVRIAHLEWDQAIALSLLQMIPTAAYGAYKRYRQGEVVVSLALATLAGTIPGSWLGRWIVGALKDRGIVHWAGRSVNLLDAALTFLFFIMLMFMSIRLLRATLSSKPEQKNTPQPEPAAPPKVKPIEALLIGLAVGLTSTLLGIGGGFLFVPLVMYRFGLPVVVAVGTSLFQMPVTAAVGAGLYMHKTTVPLLWLIPIVGGSLVGVAQGVTLSRRFDNRQYRFLLSGMQALVALLTLATWVSKFLATPKI